MIIKPGDKTTYVCPRCNQVFQVAIGNSDYVHQCNSGNATLDQEDVPVIGNWTDFTGEATIQNSTLSTPLASKIDGTKSAVQEGSEKVYPITARGARAHTHRQRQFLQYIEFKENEGDKK